MSSSKRPPSAPKPTAPLPSQAFWSQPALLSLLIGLGLTGYFYAQAYRLESDSMNVQVKSTTHDARQALESDLSKNLSTLRALRSFFAASHEVGAASFGIFAEHIFNLYPVIETLEWVPRVLAGDVKDFKTAASRPGEAEPVIYALNTAGKSVATKKKKEYYPTLFVEPLETSAAVVGFDHSSDSARLAAMTRSAEADDIAVTPVLELFSAEPEKTAAFRGFVAYLPVFASDASRRHSPRPSQLLKGYLTAVFRADELVRASMERFVPGNIRVRVYAADSSTQDTWIEILDTGVKQGAVSRRIGKLERFVHREDFVISGGRWAVECEMEENPYGHTHRTSSALLLVGILGSALLALFLILIERRKAQALVTEWSIRDELTGLYNRRGFLIFAEERMRLAQRNHAGMWMVCADLDYLKRINDTFGHAEGDKVMIRAAEVLKASFRDSDIVARIGGDEFAALVLESEENSRDAIRTRIQARVRENAAAGPSDREVSLSVGAAYISPYEDVPLEELFRRADQDLYRAKAARPHKPVVKSGKERT